MLNAAFKNKNLSRKITLALVAAYFLIACTLFLDKLELNNDESIMGIGALALIKPEVPATMLRHVNSLIMFSAHKGKAAAFPAAFLFILFGKSVFVLRFTQVLFSLGTLFCVYYVCRRQFGDTVGLLTFFLLGVDSNFIRTTRVGYLQDAISQIFLFWLGLFLVQRYLEEKRKNYLYLSAFVFGVALWAKLMVLGYFLGIAATGLLFWRKWYHFLKTKIFERKRDAVFFLFSFILGYAPALIFNSNHYWMTLRSISNSLKPINTNVQWNNLDFLGNLKIRIGNFNELLMNSNVADAIWLPVNRLSLPLFYFSLAAVLSYIFLRKSGAIKRSVSENKILFFLGVYSALLVLSCFIPSSGSFDSSHVVIMLPSVQLVEALFFGLLLVYLKVKFWPYVISLCLLLPHAAAEANIMRQLWLDLKFEKNIPTISVFNRLASFLEAANIREIFCLDERLVQNIDFISKLRIVTWGFGTDENSYWEHPYYPLREPADDLFSTVYEQRLKKLNPLYVLFDANDPNSKNMFRRLNALMAKNKVTAQLIGRFADNTGLKQFELYRIIRHNTSIAGDIDAFTP